MKLKLELARSMQSIHSEVLEENNDPTILENERLQDPLNDRVVNSVPRPPTIPLSVNRVFPLMRCNSERQGENDNGDRHEVPNLPLIKDYLMQMGTISKALMMDIINKVKIVLN